MFDRKNLISAQRYTKCAKDKNKFTIITCA
jgi:hypothetical protein